MTKNKAQFSRLDDIKFSMLKRLSNENGDILHALRKDDPSYEKFGEAYFTIVTYWKL